MLETEIKKLTAAVTRLADLMENISMPGADVDHAPNAETIEALKDSREGKTERVDSIDDALAAEKADTPDDENEQGEYTTDDIKSMALAISRKDRAKQKTIKAKLAEHDAKVAADLKGNALQVVGAWLVELKERVGA